MKAIELLGVEVDQHSIMVYLSAMYKYIMKKYSFSIIFLH